MAKGGKQPGAGRPKEWIGSDIVPLKIPKAIRVDTREVARLLDAGTVTIEEIRELVRNKQQET